MSDLPIRPRLRPDVRVEPFSSGARERTFLLSCPDGRCMEVSGRLRELLALLDGNHTCARIAEVLTSAWQAPVQERELRAWMAEQLLPRGLLVAPGDPGGRPAGSRQRPPGLRGVRLIPARALAPFSGALRFLFRPRVSLPLLWAACLCHALLYVPLLSGTAPAPSPTPQRMAAAALLLFLSVLFHELGHLSACRYFGCPHGEVRAGLYLVFPVLYADVSAAWRLSRKERLVVDLGGVYFQLLLTLPLYLLLLLTQDPLCLLLLLQLDAMVLLALNPFLRFDGYWVCSDLLGVANLRARSLQAPRALLRRIRGKGDARRHPFLSLRPAETAGLLLYAAGSCAFTLLVLALLARLLPERLADLPALLRETAALVAGRPRPPGASGAWSVLFSLLASLVLLFACGRTLWRGGRGIAGAVKRRRRRKGTPGRPSAGGRRQAHRGSEADGEQGGPGPVPRRDDAPAGRGPAEARHRS